MPIRFTACAAVLLATLASCASTTLESTWRDPAYQGGPFQKLAVIVLGKQEATTRGAEDTFVAGLAPGTQGVQSYTFLEAADAGNPEAVKAKLRSQGCDGALVARVIGVDTSVEYVPGNWSSVPVGHRSFGGYYGSGYAAVYSPGYVEENVTVRVVTNVYDVASEKLVWSGVTETFEPSSTGSLVADNAEVILAALAELGLIARPAGKD